MLSKKGKKIHFSLNFILCLLVFLAWVGWFILGVADCLHFPSVIYWITQGWMCMCPWFWDHHSNAYAQAVWILSKTIEHIPKNQIITKT